MKRSNNFVLSAVVLLGLTMAAKEEPLPNPLLMNQSRFEREIFGGESIDALNLSLPEQSDYVWLIYFSAPWCA